MLLDRLFSRLLRSSDDCWEWQGMRISKGYGKIRDGQRMVAVHRLMYESVHGVTLTPEQQVLHSCDNPCCCNPGHLSIGTNRDNIEDKIRKDRSGKKLNIAKVQGVKVFLALGFTQVEIARMFGVNPCTISRIATGDRWSHLNEDASAEQAPQY